MAKAGRQLESLALQAVAAVDPREAEGVWMMAFERLTALGSSSKRLIQALVHRLTGLRKGPLRVSSPLFCCMLLHTLGREADRDVIMHESICPCMCRVSAGLASWPHQDICPCCMFVYLSVLMPLHYLITNNTSRVGFPAVRHDVGWHGLCCWGSCRHDQAAAVSASSKEAL